VLEMRATGEAWPEGVVDALIATSAQAFELLADTPEWPLPEARGLMPLFLVGTRTEEAARIKGFSGRATIAPDAKILAQMLVEKLPAPARLLYLAGHDRKPDLEDRLAEAAHLIETVEVYAAEPASALQPDAVAALESGFVGAVLHYSRRSAGIFLKLTENAGLDAASWPHVCISQDAAEPLREAGCETVHIAEKPNEQSMVALVMTLSHVEEGSP